MQRIRLAASGLDQGFTLIELLIATAISGLVLGTMVNMFITQRKTYAVQEQITEAMQNARTAMDMIAREVRMAGYNPTRAAFQGIPYSATQLQLQADRTGDGDVSDPDEDVLYTYNSSTRQIIRTSGGVSYVVANHIQSLTFMYRDGSGNPTTTTADIRQVAVTITARTAKPDQSYPANNGYRTYMLTSVMTARNLEL
jgi:type IV pilus assembly protein PilW